MKPRYKVWLKAVGGIFVIPTLLALVSLFAPNTRQGLLTSATMVAGGLVVLAVSIYRERWGRVHALHFWDDGTEFRIIIRNARTGEVLLQSRERTLAGQDLRGARLAGASFAWLDLEHANFEGAMLQGADLRYCTFKWANLEGADLSFARLSTAALYKANLRFADLRGADFGGRLSHFVTPSDLAYADLTGACYNSATRWPAGFDPAAHGCVYEEEGADLPIPHLAESRPENQALPIIDHTSAPEELPQRIVQ
ncbi:MAG: pentapeptide repeat-containing protein [Actinomycetota bacterium]